MNEEEKQKLINHCKIMISDSIKYGGYGYTEQVYRIALASLEAKPVAWLTWHSIPPSYQEPDRGGEYLAVHENPGEISDDGTVAFPVYRKHEVT